jgi:T5SS/PEP-CTERM-associated repeat protein
MGTYTWTGDGGNFSLTDPANWVDENGNQAVPGPNDTADIPITTTVSGALDVASLSIEGVVTYQGGSLFIGGNLLVNTASGNLTLESHVGGTIDGDLIVGQATFTSGPTQTYESTLSIYGGSTITVQGSAVLGGASGSSGQIYVYNDGELDVDGDLDVGVYGLGAIYNGEGTISVADGSSILLGGTNASYLSQIYMAGPAELVTDEPLVVGDNGNSEFDLEAGATYTTFGSLVLGLNGYGFIQDDNSTLNVSGDLVMGASGQGGLEIDFFPNSGPSITRVSGDAIIGAAQYESGAISIGTGGTLAILGGHSLVLGLAFDSVGALTIAAPGAVVDITGTIIAGDAGEAEIAVQNGGTLNITGDQALAVQSTASASVYIATAGSLSVSGSLVGGQDGNASVLVESGGILRATDLVLGEFAGGSGIVTNSGGTLTVGGDVQVGEGGSGGLTISNAGLATSADGEVGTGAGNTGNLVVDGPGSSWAITNNLTIGVAGGTGTTSATISNQASITTTTSPGKLDILFSGMLTLETGAQLIETGLDMHDPTTLTIESGATLAEVANSTPSTIYDGLGANGTVTIDAGTIASAGEYITVGETTVTGGPGNATLTASDGSTIIGLATDLAEDVGDSGTVTLDGSATTWTDTFDTPVDSNDSGFNVGVNGNGSLLIEDGATLSNPLAYIKVGQDQSATGTATVTDPGSVMSAAGLLRVGDSGQGTLTVANEALAAAGAVQVGDFGGSNGWLTITTGGTVTTNSASTVDAGPQLGGAVTEGNFTIGVLTGSKGTVAVDGGTLTVEGSLLVGDGGSGSLMISDGGVVTSTAGEVGTSAGNTGTLILDGPGSSWTITNGLSIGVDGGTGTTSATISNQASITTSTDIYDRLYSGALTLETGGQLIENEFGLDMHDAATLTIESGATLAETASSTPSTISDGLVANGTVTIDAGTVAAAGEYITVGELTTTGGAGNATLTASDGSTIIGLATDLAEDVGDSGTVTLDGPATTWTDTFDTPVDSNDAGFNVGVEGNGSLLIEDGATLSNPLAYIKIGQFSTATGTATVTGAGSVMSAGGLLRVGDSGQGTLMVENDALAAVGAVQVGVYTGSTGLLTISSGGSLTTNSASTVDVGTLGGGAEPVTEGNFTIGVINGSKGTVAVDGGTLTVEGSLQVGDNGSGSLMIGDGGLVSAVAVHVGAHGTVAMNGGVLDPPGSILIDNGGSVGGMGSIDGDVSNNGVLYSAGGALQISGAVTGTGQLTVEAAAGLELGGTVGTGETVSFDGSGATLTLDDPLDFTAAITGIEADDVIDLTNIIASSVTYDGTHLTVTQTDGGPTVSLALSSNLADAGQFNVATSGGLSGETITPACFVSGTRIATPDGEVAIEDLRVGDSVLTESGQSAAIIWRGFRHVVCAHHPDPKLVWPVCIKAHAFAACVPTRDLWLSPDHAIFDGSVLIPIKHLINGVSIFQVRRESVTYWHLELARHDIILANNLPTETYLDTGNRDAFTNSGGITTLNPNFARHPDHANHLWEALGYTSLVVTGPEITRLRNQLIKQTRLFLVSQGM